MFDVGAAGVKQRAIAEEPRNDYFRERADEVGSSRTIPSAVQGRCRPIADCTNSHGTCVSRIAWTAGQRGQVHSYIQMMGEGRRRGTIMDTWGPVRGNATGRAPCPFFASVKKKDTSHSRNEEKGNVSIQRPIESETVYAV